jgi:hypothetical protein
MPKRWKVSRGSKLGLELWDTDTNKILAKSVARDWDDDDTVDDLVEEFREAEIEFSNGDVKPPKRKRT